MELRLFAEDLKALANQGLLDTLIRNCTVGGEEVKPEEVAEEKPKKKRTTKKKEELPPTRAAAPTPETTVAEASQEVAETTAPTPVNVEPEPGVEEEPAVIVEEFNIETLAQRAIGLMDAGKGPQLQTLLQKFGVVSLPELAPENYAAFYSEMGEL